MTKEPKIAMTETLYVGVLPYGQAAVVKFKANKVSDELFTTDGEGDEAYLIDSISYGNGTDVRYSIIGHDNLNTRYCGSAWHNHHLFDLIAAPSLESWNMLAEANDDGEGPEDDDDDSDEDEEDFETIDRDGQPEPKKRVTKQDGD